MITFGFVEITVVHRMKELYFAALKSPASWPAVVEQCRKEVDALAAAAIDDMERELGRHGAGA